MLPPGETPTQPGACGPGLLKDTATLPDDVTRQLDVSPGYVKLGNATGVASITAAVVEPSQLPGSPPTWELLACGIRTTATSPTGDPVVLFRGPAQKVCFNIPGGYSKYRISYYDPTPTIARWVGLSTVVDSVQNVACTSPTFRLPALFALFGQL